MGACGRAKSRSLPTRRDAVAIDGSSTAASCYGRGLDFPIRTQARGWFAPSRPAAGWDNSLHTVGSPSFGVIHC